ncbi:DUF417 family protein [Mycolicibacterium sp. P9-64]|uniref:DUF417 family protein n=1 Tax=Mycolicibacterium sp. P9-64 TaxID=2024612 RepID=UPI0011EDD4F9|nr:DUF417 family protein [Mycolicibacterium sp. P9-64]KAA0086557.1 DUF417 family protein [Mycolicibacterium sp. P9-64]
MTVQHVAVDRASRIAGNAGAVILRIGLVVPLAWIGIQKFTAEEASAIMPLILHQPLMSWLYDVADGRTLSTGLGIVEIAAAILIAIRIFSPIASAVGSAIATLLFLSTISFLFTTPGVVAGSSLHISLLTDTGGFLIKDIVLLGAAVWTFGEALGARSTARA